MRRPLGWLATGAVIATGWLLALRVMVEPPPAPDALPGAETGAVELMPYARVTAEQRPRFRLLGGERQLKLVTHAVLDAPTPHTPDRVTVYGVRLTLTDLDGAVRWSGLIYTSGRRSVDPQTGEQPDAWLPDAPGRAVLDSRVIQFDIPVAIPPESRLEVERVGEADELLVRLFAREAPSSGVTLRAVDLLFDQPDDLGGVDAHLPRHLRWVRRQTEAPTVQLARTGNRRPFEENEAQAFVPVEPLRPIALNVEGPTTLTVRTRRGAEAAEAPRSADGTVTFDDVATTAPIEGGAIAIPGTPDDVSVATIAIPAGVHSLRFRTEAEGGARVQVTAPGGRTPPVRFGDVPTVPMGDAELMLPDERRFPVFVAGPDEPPVIVRIEGPDDDLARLIRLDARLFGDAPPLDAGLLDLRWFDDERLPLERRAVPVESPRAPFEVLERRRGVRSVVSEPYGVRVAVPAGARWLEVRAEQPIAVRAFVLYPTPPPHLDLPYRDHLPPEHIWRYGPRAFRIWHPVRPVNRDALRAVEAIATMVAQVRLEPTGGGDAETPPRAFDPIDPVGRPPRERVVEDVPPGRRDPDDAVVATLPLGRAATFDLDADDRARPRLQIVARTDAPLGQTLTVELDGEPTEIPIAASRQSWRLPPLMPGRHTIRARAPVDADALWLMIDRALDGEPWFRRRSLYALGRQPLTMRVPVPRGGATLNAIVYDRRPDAVASTRIVAEVDGGQPRRRRGEPVETFTLARQVETLPPARTPRTTARLLDRVGETAGHPRTVPIHLGADLVPGPHTVRIHAESDRYLWVRFIISDTLIRDRERARTDTFTEAP